MPTTTLDGAILKAIIHIGAEKTGTTSIQAFCSANRALLAKQGVLFPRVPGFGQPYGADRLRTG